MTATCQRCGAAYAAQRSTARYCSPACKKAAQRARRAQEAAVVVPVEFLGPVTKATRAELDAAGVLSTALAQIAVVLARLIDSAGPGQGSAVASWCKEHRACMAAAVQAAPTQADDPLAKIRAKRASRMGKTTPG